MTRSEIERQLADVERQISDAYWRFSHSPSPRVGPPSAHLYAQRTALRCALNEIDGKHTLILTGNVYAAEPRKKSS